jgi:outer membrane protein assembly factor BamB
MAWTAAAALVVTLAPATAAQRAGADRFWPQWRGPHATGVSTTATPPVEWSESKNIRWKVRVPGRGHASPVVWGDRVYLMTAVPAGLEGDAQHASLGSRRPPHKYVVTAIDRATGKTAWERVAREEAPHEAAHADNGSWASPSPIVDGTHVIASFESRGIYAYTLDGTLAWEKDLGDKRMRNEFGEGSTPALYGDTLVVVWDHLNGDSFVVALDKRNGLERWRVARDEIDTWATPLVLEVNGRAQAIVPAMNRNRAYDLETGAVVWEGEGLTMNPIPSPVHEDGLVVLMSGFRGNDLRVVRVADAKGDIDGTDAVVWSFDRDTPYVPSPLLVDGILYFLKTNSGLLSAFDVKTGTPHYQNQRIEGVPNVFASPVSADGRLYIAGREGTTAVIRTGPTFELLATNALDDEIDASPALVGDTIYLRGHRSLYAIGPP